MHLDDILALAVQESASDIHISAERTPIVRVNGMLQEVVNAPNISASDILSTTSLLTDSQRALLHTHRELGIAHQLDATHRFRVNFFWEKGALGIVARLIPQEIPTPESIGLPEIVRSFMNLKDGLVLVTGPTGQGKSTTLASVLNAINKERAESIVTLEDPIEYVFAKGKSVIKQREVGSDVPSFSESLKYVVRHDPDIIMVGEMRDHETMAATITLAETGHLVFSTLHTVNAAQTIHRIIDAFPVQQHSQVRTQLATTLRGIISQRLVGTVDGKLIAAREVLVNTPAVSNLIRENKIEHIASVIQTGAKYGMITMDASLRQLYERGIISRETMQKYASDPRV